jgi:hypothetical protein
MSLAALQSIDSGLKLTTVTPGATTYSLCSEVGNKAAFVNGPGGSVTDDPDGAC